MPLIVGIITHTPLWVWFVLAGLIFLGLRRTRTRQVHATSLMVTAGIFALLAASRLVMGHFAGPAVLGTLAGAIAAAAILFVVKPGSKATRLSDGTLQIEGEWFSLMLILAVFAANYGIAVLAAMDPVVGTGDNARFVYSFVNGLSATFMIGRTASYLRTQRA